MRTCAIIAVIFLLFASASRATDLLELEDNWSLQSSAKIDAKGESVSTAAFKPEGWYSISVPRTVLAALVDNHVYPDPMVGDNIKQIPGYKGGYWLVMPQDSPFYPSWWYRKEFELPNAFKGKNLALHLDGINYRANVWLNGKRVADDQAVVGMFRRFEFDVSDYIVPGKNCLSIEVTGPAHLPEKDYHSKQVEATTDWDDHCPIPPDRNAGIWQKVYITASGPVALRNPYVESKLEVPSLESAALTVSVTAINKTAQKVTGKVGGELFPANSKSGESFPAYSEIAFEQDVELGPKETKVITFTPDRFPQLVIKHPRVWWPNNLGSPELYEAELKFSRSGQGVATPCLSDAIKTTFGIRDATTYINEEGWRAYKINGQRVLIRGGAWMTSDMLLRLDHRRYEALIRYAKEGNLNMLRSEGFSIRETDDFYDLCDKYGIMVTQQIFGRSIPDEDLAISCVKDMLLRIRNHPSLVHFLGHDETFPTERLDKAYRDLIAEYTPTRTYQPHSGAFELKERFKTGGTRTGSLEVWSYASPIHYYTSKNTSAWGFAQSGGIGGVFSPFESMQRMLPEKDRWPVLNDTWWLHTVAQEKGYFGPVFKAIKDRYGEAKDMKDLCQKGLALNYECARGMFEAYGRNKYSATGITTWKYDAAWPASPTWQYIDWYLIPTGAYFGAKKACEPLHVQYSYDNNSIYVVNALYHDWKGLKVTARVFNMDMTEKYAKDAVVDVASDGTVNAFTIDFPKDLTKTYFLVLCLEDADGKLVSDNFYWLSTVPDIPNIEWFFAFPKSTPDYTDLASLPRVKLNVETKFADAQGEKVAEVTLENPSNQLAFFVRLAVTKGSAGEEVSPVYWIDNYISVLPHEKRAFSGKFSGKDLENAAPAIRVEGWNLE